MRQLTEDEFDTEFTVVTGREAVPDSNFGSLSYRSSGRIWSGELAQRNPVSSSCMKTLASLVSAG